MQPFVCGILIWLSLTDSGDFSLIFYQILSENFCSKFHLYVCAAFLKRWKSELEQKKDFQGILLFIQVLVINIQILTCVFQNVPTAKWNDKDISLLVADAYQLK